MWPWVKKLFIKKSAMQKLPTQPGWEHISLYRDGDDLVILNAVVTCFGGTNDKMDSGETASGVSTKNPKTLGCALPRRYKGRSKAQLAALGGSPIPASLPFKTPITFTYEDKSISCNFIDIGPARWTGNAGDLTVAAAKKFNPNATANNFKIKGVTIRIPGGANYL